MEKIFKKPLLIVLIILSFTLFFGTQIPRVQMDNNNMRFLPEGNQAKIISNYIDETFGGLTIILVGLERPYKTVFESEFLALIKEYSKAVENIEFIKDVNSIMSMQYITGDNESIIVTDLVPQDFSGTEEEIAELRRRIASWDLFQGALVSDDFSATQIIITLDVKTEESTSPEVTRSLEKIQELTHRMFDGLAEVYITGIPVISAAINNSMIRDNLVLIPLVIIVLLAVLFFSFRRLAFIILPLLTVAIAVIWTIGIAALFGIKLSILTTILPVILLAVGSAYGIHVITHYARDMQGKTLTIDEHRAIVLEIIRKLFKPVSLAALTTLTGFVSFCFTPIVPIKEFGLCASVGVIAAFVITFTFIPAMLLLRGPRSLKMHKSEQIEINLFNNTIAGFFFGIAQKKILVLFFAAITVIISAYGLSKVIVDNVIVDFFQKGTGINRSDRFIREYFGGSKELSLVIEADTTEELLHPDVLQAIDGLSVFLGRIPEVGRVVGFTDIIKRVNQVFNVGESPEGLRKYITYNASDSFGFNDFGFGDFEFDNFGFNSFEYDDDEFITTTPSNDSNYDLTQYSAVDLISFLDTAAGKSPALNGNDLVRELKSLTNYEGMAYYEIPSDPRRYGKETPQELAGLISNYLVLIAGGDNAGYYNDPLEPTVIRTMIQLRTTGDRDTQEVIEKLNAYIAVNFPKNIKVKLGGGAIIESAVTSLIVRSSVISIALSVLIVFLIVAISNKSFVAGFIGAIVLALAIICNFAIMGFTGIKLNIATALMGSLTVGIGIDYTIHFIEFYKREFISASAHAKKCDFLRRTFIGCGKAIITNAVSVGAGFAVLAFSQFRIIAELGIIIALCMGITAFISLTLIPALLLVIKPRFIYSGVVNNIKCD